MHSYMTEYEHGNSDAAQKYTEDTNERCPHQVCRNELSIVDLCFFFFFFFDHVFPLCCVVLGERSCRRSVQDTSNLIANAGKCVFPQYSVSLKGYHDVECPYGHANWQVFQVIIH